MTVWLLLTKGVAVDEGWRDLVLVFGLAPVEVLPADMVCGCERVDVEWCECVLVIVEVCCSETVCWKVVVGVLGWVKVGVSCVNEALWVFRVFVMGDVNVGVACRL